MYLHMWAKDDRIILRSLLIFKEVGEALGYAHCKPRIREATVQSTSRSESNELMFQFKLMREDLWAYKNQN